MFWYLTRIIITNPKSNFKNSFFSINIRIVLNFLMSIYCQTLTKTTTTKVLICYSNRGPLAYFLVALIKIINKTTLPIILSDETPLGSIAPTRSSYDSHRLAERHRDAVSESTIIIRPVPDLHNPDVGLSIVRLTKGFQ